MKRHFVVGAILACTALTGLAPGRAQTQTPSPAKSAKPWLLTGRVMSHTGQPLEGVAVTAKVSGAPLAVSVYTEADGRYYFPPLHQGGAYVVTAQAVGFKRALSELKLVRGVNGADLTLSPTDDVMLQLSGWQQLARLPEDTREDRRGKAILLKACSQCHQLTRIFARRFDERGWSGVIDSMAVLGGVGEGSPGDLPKAQKQELAAYLTRVAGPSRAELKPAPEARPRGEAQNALFYEYTIPNAEGRYGFGTGDWADGPPILTGVGTALHDATVDLDGNPWLASTDRIPGRTIVKMDRDTGQSTAFAYAGDEPGNSARSHGMITARNGVIWFTNAPGRQLLLAQLGYINPATGEIGSYPVPQGRVPVGGWLNEDGRGAIWTSTGTARGQEGVWRFDPKTKTFEQFKSLTDGFTYGAAGDRAGNGWWAQMLADKVAYVDLATRRVGEIVLPFTWAGAPFLKPGDMTQEEYLSVIAGVGGMRGNAHMPRRLKGDMNADVVWVANYSGGALMRIDTKTHATTLYPAPAAGMNPYDVGIDSSHRVWMGLQNGDEVARFDPKTESWTLFPLPVKGASPRNLMLVERAGHIEVVVPILDAHKVVRMIPRSAQEVATLKRRYYASAGSR